MTSSSCSSDESQRRQSLLKCISAKIRLLSLTIFRGDDEMLSDEELRPRERKRVMIAAGPLCVLLPILFFAFGARPAVHAIKAFQDH
jgi:hypothetical protein